MKGKFGKIGLLCLVVLVALGAMGVGLAQWQKNQTIEGTAETGSWQGYITNYFALCLSHCIDVDPRWDCWEPPGVSEHSFTVTIDDDDDDNGHCGGCKCWGRYILVFYRVTNGGTVPIRLDTIDTDISVDWLEVVCHTPACPPQPCGSPEDAELEEVKGQIEARCGCFCYYRTCQLEPGEGTWIWILFRVNQCHLGNETTAVTITPVFQPWNN
jgi:hypothetical protein